MDALLIAARLLQFAAAAGLGTALFFVYGVAPDPQAAWRRAMAAVFAIGAVAALSGLMVQAAQFGQAADAFSPARVWDVAQTSFGRAAAARLAAFAIAAVLAAAGSWRLTAVAGAVAAASFAFGGHAAADDNPLHLAADIVHALAAAIWLGALPPLLRLARAQRLAATRAGLERFSRIGPAVVALLAASGLVNGWLLVGPGKLGALLTDPYGRLLTAKLVLFAAMLALAAANRWRLTSRLAGPDKEAAGRAVASTLLAETLLGLAVLALVGVLGTLAPPGG